MINLFSEMFMWSLDCTFMICDMCMIMEQVRIRSKSKRCHRQSPQGVAASEVVLRKQAALVLQIKSSLTQKHVRANRFVSFSLQVRLSHHTDLVCQRHSHVGCDGWWTCFVKCYCKYQNHPDFAYLQHREEALDQAMAHQPLHVGTR